MSLKIVTGPEALLLEDSVSSCLKVWLFAGSCCFQNSGCFWCHFKHDLCLQVRRFSRFVLGEGIEKKSGDFAAEVAAATGKA